MTAKNKFQILMLHPKKHIIKEKKFYAYKVKKYLYRFLIYIHKTYS